MSEKKSPPRTYRLTLLGFGNVGQAFAELLIKKEAKLLDELGLNLRVVGIATGSHGAAVNPRGLDLAAALALRKKGNSLDSLTTEQVLDSHDFILKTNADALVESTPVNYQTGQPALSFLRTALSHQMHALTANKGPVVHGYRELTDLAEKQDKAFYFESAVMDGAPVFSLARWGLPGADISGIRGVFNSTTNLILTRMETGETFAEAVAYAQKIGIAETDPSGDIDGWDAAIKVAALVTVMMDIPLLPSEVKRTGIREITRDQVQQAAADGQRWKLVCSAERAPSAARGVTARVSPQLVDPSSALYHVTGTSAVLEIESDVLGRLSLREDDPSPMTTAYGLLADLINALKR